MSQVTETWLMSNTVTRCVLAKVDVYKVGTGEISLYLSTHNYVAGSTVYTPIISGGLQFSESMSINGNVSSSFGDLEINNSNGDFDSWIDDTQYIWVNRDIQLYYGDPSWIATSTADVATEFELIFEGVIVDLAARSRNKLNIKVRDKMERLNNPVTEVKLGTYGTWGASAQPNVDAIKPLVFGEVHNMTPLQMDPAELRYMANFGPTELLLEIRDNGLPIHTSGGVTGADISLLATQGYFDLTAAPAGQITISVQGVNNSINLSTGALITGTYNNKIANLIALITTQYGLTGSKLTAADLDLTNLAAFDSSITYPVGVIISDQSTVKTICGYLAESVNAQLFFSRIGKLQLLRTGTYTSDPVVTITDRDILYDTLSVNEKVEVIAASKIAYCKNWTVQRDLTTSIPDSHKNMFAEEWMTVTSTVDTSAVKTLYKINSEPQQKNTYLIDTASAQTLANNIATYYSTSRVVYTFIGTPRMQLLKIGQQVTLTHNRFGLSGGKTGQVVQLSPNWTTGLVNVGVLI